MPEFQVGGGSCKIRREEADARRVEMQAQRDANLKRQQRVAGIIAMLKSQRGESLRRLLSMFPCTGILDAYHKALLTAEVAEHQEAALAECDDNDPFRRALVALAAEYQPKEPNL